MKLCGLLELKALRELEIEDYYYVDEFEWDNNEITFHGGVLPLLKAFGSSLVRLTLYQLNIWVNIRAIAKLEYLTLDDIARCLVVLLEEESHHEEVMLKHLKKLRLDCLSRKFVWSISVQSYFLCLCVTFPWAFGVT